ncbi:MAG TPA: NFACT family protein [Candidatus Merdenecus merdavium]|nr:NFACT family protein [Candidatus Merdenecus merdavium]
MAFDGIVISNIVKELNHTILGGRINKIAQPENDELLLTIKSNKTQYRLLISASASLPLIYYTKHNKVSPLTAPNFCMLLRKHLNNSRIIEISQPSLERIIEFKIEHLNELGDVCYKVLIVEIMGKHSNIIFCDDKKMIIDSIKHISAHISSIREVLPGRSYFIPETMHKLNPLTVEEDDFLQDVFGKPTNVSKAIYTSFTGISPVVAEEICYRAGLDSDVSANSLSEIEKTHLFHTFLRTMDDVKEGNFHPNIIFKDEEPLEYASIELTQYSSLKSETYESISELLETYYATKNIITRIRQKSTDLRKVVQTSLERNYKKLDLQKKQMKDTEKKDKYKIYGELINAYGYDIEEGVKHFEALNYYTNERITIPLDPTLSPSQNAQRYFERYNKLKRTFDALTVHLKETEDEITHLESISNALNIALTDDDLNQIKEELMDYGYVKRKHTKHKKMNMKSEPFHYISSDGYHMYVGKNNFQNEELTFKFAVGHDWWFHAKGVPGSHVIVKSNGDELPDRTFEEAGKLAGYYSSLRGAKKVEIDYTEKKNIKKPSGGKPGFVIYYTNYSFVIDAEIAGIAVVDNM